MDPWAEDGGGFTEESPSSRNAPPQRSPVTTRSQSISAYDVDPWADTGPGNDRRTQDKQSPATVPDQANSSPPEKPHRPSPISATEKMMSPVSPITRRQPSGSIHAEPDSFDPWGGSADPNIPTLSYTSVDAAKGEGDNSSIVEGTKREKEEKESKPSGWVSEPPVSSMVDPDDPWGSSEAARRAKIEREQEVEEIARRLEGMNNENQSAVTAHEEGKGSDDANVGKSNGESSSPAPTTTGWRSFFTRNAKNNPPTESKQAEDPKQELEAPQSTANGQDATSTTTSSSAAAAAAAAYPRASNASSAPRLWQAPSLGRSNTSGHARSSSSVNSASAAPSSSQQQASSSSPVSGPGWEVTTSKKGTGSAGGGGLFSNIWGGNSSNQTSGMGSLQAAAPQQSDKMDVTSAPNCSSGSNQQQQKNPTGLEARLEAVRQSLRPPEVVSAVDPEDEEYETEETGLEWETGADQSTSVKPKSRPVQATTQPSVVAKLFGRWRKGAQDDVKDVNGQHGQGMTEDDLSWLENVGAGQLEASKPKGMDAAEEEDWLKFVSDANTSKKVSSPNPSPGFDIRSVNALPAMRPHSPPRLSGPPRSSTNPNRGSLLNFEDDQIGPISTSQAQPLSRPQQATSSSLSYRQPRQASVTQHQPGTRFASGGSQSTMGTPGSADAFGDFGRFESSHSGGPSPAIDEFSWHNNAGRLANDSLLDGQGRARARLEDSRGRFGVGLGSSNAIKKDKYDYDEEEIEEEERRMGESGGLGPYRDADPPDRFHDKFDDDEDLRYSRETSNAPTRSMQEHFDDHLPPSPPSKGYGGRVGVPHHTTSKPMPSFRNTDRSSPASVLPPPPPSGRPLSMNVNSGLNRSKSSTVNQSNQQASPQQLGGSVSPPPSWDGSKPLSQSQMPASQSQKPSVPKKLSQGNTLTSDDLNFFESL